MSKVKSKLQRSCAYKNLVQKRLDHIFWCPQKRKTDSIVYKSLGGGDRFSEAKLKNKKQLCAIQER